MRLKSEPAERQADRIGYASIVAAAALFGSVFTVAKSVLGAVEPLSLSALIYIISGLALIPFGRGSFKLGSRSEYGYILIVTLLGAVAAPAMLLIGLNLTSSSDASILSNAEMIFTIILSAIFFGEKPKGRSGVAGVAIVMVGLIIATTDFKISDTLLQFKIGNLLILASMMMWAIDNNFSRRLTLSDTTSPAKIAMMKSLFGGLILMSIVVIMGRGAGIGTIAAKDWLVIILMSVSGFGAALLLFLHALKRIGTVKTMTGFSMTPVFGIAIAGIVGGEPISAFQILATGMIIAGIFLAGRR